MILLGMERKILFLDFDGVINSDATFFEAFKYAPHSDASHTGKVLSSGNVAMIQHIMEETDCDVVFTTNWRLQLSEDELNQALVEVGMQLPRERFIGKTSRLSFSTSRHGAEILNYINDYDIKTFVILDDEDQEISTYFIQYDSFLKNIEDATWIRTETSSGLLTHQMYAAISILGKTT